MYKVLSASQSALRMHSGGPIKISFVCRQRHWEIYEKTAQRKIMFKRNLMVDCFIDTVVKESSFFLLGLGVVEEFIFICIHTTLTSSDSFLIPVF